MWNTATISCFKNGSLPPPTLPGSDRLRERGAWKPVRLSRSSGLWMSVAITPRCLCVNLQLKRNFHLKFWIHEDGIGASFHCLCRLYPLLFFWPEEGHQTSKLPDNKSAADRAPLSLVVPSSHLLLQAARITSGTIFSGKEQNIQNKMSSFYWFDSSTFLRSLLSLLF